MLRGLRRPQASGMPALALRLALAARLAEYENAIISSIHAGTCGGTFGKALSNVQVQHGHGSSEIGAAALLAPPGHPAVGLPLLATALKTDDGDIDMAYQSQAGGDREVSRFSSLNGLVLLGYQGWFGAAADGCCAEYLLRR